MSKDKLNDFITLPPPTDDLDFFETIKNLSKKYWLDTEINMDIFGFQIQNGSNWRDGLLDDEIIKFENELGYKFPAPLRNYYKTMNGLDKKGINVYGNNGDEFSYRPIYYSYPDDLQIIRENIEWIYKATGMNTDKLIQEGISRIFPVCGHRFILIDDPKHRILSMYGRDIIAWADNISKLLVTDIFDNISNASDFESNRNDFNIKFWLDNK